MYQKNLQKNHVEHEKWKGIGKTIVGRNKDEMERERDD